MNTSNDSLSRYARRLNIASWSNRAKQYSSHCWALETIVTTNITEKEVNTRRAPLTEFRWSPEIKTTPGMSLVWAVVNIVRPVSLRPTYLSQCRTPRKIYLRCARWIMKSWAIKEEITPLHSTLHLCKPPLTWTSPVSIKGELIPRAQTRHLTKTGPQRQRQTLSNFANLTLKTRAITKWRKALLLIAPPIRTRMRT